MKVNSILKIVRICKHVILHLVVLTEFFPSEKNYVHTSSHIKKKRAKWDSGYTPAQGSAHILLLSSLLQPYSSGLGPLLPLRLRREPRGREELMCQGPRNGSLAATRCVLAFALAPPPCAMTGQHTHKRHDDITSNNKAVRRQHDTPEPTHVMSGTA
jgi:hypothetical protein